jgi:hypothetical protein
MRVNVCYNNNNSDDDSEQDDLDQEGGTGEGTSDRIQKTRQAPPRLLSGGG